MSMSIFPRVGPRAAGRRDGGLHQGRTDPWALGSRPHFPHQRGHHRKKQCFRTFASPDGGLASAPRRNRARHPSTMKTFKNSGNVTTTTNDTPAGMRSSYARLMAIQVVLDTNIFFNDKTRQSAPFITLSRLCKRKEVQVMLPHVVVREYQTQLRKRCADDVKAVLDSSRSLLAHGVPDGVREPLEAMVDRVKAQQEDLLAGAHGAFDQWVVDNAVVVMPLSLAQTEKAMEAYFTGKPPFPTPKERKHIPDSFVYQVLVESIAAGPINFVCHDHHLRDQAAKIDGVTVYEKLTDFIATKEVQALLSAPDGPKVVAVDFSKNVAVVEGWMEAEVITKEQLAKEAEAAEHVKKILAQLEQFAKDDPLLRDHVIENGAALLANTSFQSKSIPGDDHEAYVQAYGPLTSNVRFFWNEAVFMGDSTYVVPYKGTGEMLIDYYLHKGDLWQVEDRGVSLTDQNRNVFAVQEERAVTVRGNLTVVLEDGFTPGDDLAEAVSDLWIDTIEAAHLAEDD